MTHIRSQHQEMESHPRGNNAKNRSHWPWAWTMNRSPVAYGKGWWGFKRGEEGISVHEERLATLTGCHVKRTTNEHMM